MEEESDLDLIGRIDRGDEAAFASLYRRHQRWVVGLASRWTGDRDLALDVLQETFLYFSQKFPGFRLTTRFRTFLYPVVYHLSITAARKRQRYQSTEQEQNQMQRIAAVDPRAGREDALRAALASLSPDHRETLWLRFVDGFELQEIADAMKAPLGTVKSRLHNAIGILRRDSRTRNFFKE
jgi:RNA polymerase sigma-70 factor (ECF subfamily)